MEPLRQWPPDESLLAVDGFDVALGSALLAALVLVLAWGVGLLGVAIALAAYLLLAVLIGVVGRHQGQPTKVLIRVCPRLAAGALGRWFTP